MKTLISSPSEFITACGLKSCRTTSSEISTIYKGEIIYFCVEVCKEEIEAYPEKFIQSDHFLIDLQVISNLQSKLCGVYIIVRKSRILIYSD